jgi:hypothetical protein
MEKHIINEFNVGAFTSISLIVLAVIIGTIVALSMNNKEPNKSNEKYQNKAITR